MLLTSSYRLRRKLRPSEVPGLKSKKRKWAAGGFFWCRARLERDSDQLTFWNVENCDQHAETRTQNGKIIKTKKNWEKFLEKENTEKERKKIYIYIKSNKTDKYINICKVSIKNLRRMRDYTEADLRGAGITWSKKWHTPEKTLQLALVVCLVDCWVVLDFRSIGCHGH